jgi:formylglycine-generating enzyme required for sulfatase activity
MGPGDDIPMDPLPSQGAGPHFVISESGRIANAPAGALDAHGNDIRRIRQLVRLARDAAEDFTAALAGSGNTFPKLVRDANKYREEISKEPPDISWGLLWGLGVRLEEAAAAAERAVEDRLAPTLEDAAMSSLQSLRTLHAPLILATAEGRELQDHADRMRMTREEQAELREDASALAANLARNPELVEADAAGVISEAANAIGEGRHPERGTIFGLSTIKHVSIVLVGAALASLPTLFAPTVLGVPMTMGAWASVQKTPMYAAAISALGEAFHQLLEKGGTTAQEHLARLAPFRRFVSENEADLRRIANRAPQLRWMNAYIDYLVGTRPRAPASISVHDDVSSPGWSAAAAVAEGWADEWGTDQDGVWVRFSVTGADGTTVSQRMHWIPPGRFWMGSPEDEEGRYPSEGPRHEVTIHRGFWMWDTACTEAVWSAVTGEKPHESLGATFPATQVSWHDVHAFLGRLNALKPGLNLVLPSEARWEYACRAGTETPYSFGVTINSGLARCDSGSAVPVDHLPPNGWGLRQMHGNVFEWCEDDYHNNYTGAPTDGTPWIDDGRRAAFRVFRGGSWFESASAARAAARDRQAPSHGIRGLGFRCVRIQ